MASSDFQSIMESLNKTAELVMKTIRPRIERVMADTMKAMRPIARHIQWILEEHELNITTGWWYPNYVVGDLPSKLVYTALQNEAQKKTFTRLVMRECRRDDGTLLREMRARWQGYGFVGVRRKQILDDVVSAHLEGKYTLSIPVAMVQVDYFYHTIFPASKELPIVYTTSETVTTGQQLNFARHFGKENYKRVPASVYFELYPVYHYFKNILYATEKLRGFQKAHSPEIYKLSNPNNRGAILHGVNTSYSSEARSLKQILLLDKLLYVINKLQAEKE